MSDEFVDTSPAGTGDEGGLGEPQGPPEPADPTFGLGKDEGEDRGPAGSKSAEDEAAAWLASLSDEDRAYVQSKGFQDPGQVVRSQREAEANMHRLNGQMATFEAYIRQQQEAERYAGQPQNEPADPLQTFVQQASQRAGALGMAVDQGELAPGEALAYQTQELVQGLAQIIAQRDEQWMERVQQAAEEATAPLYDSEREAFYAQRIDEVRSQLGEDEYASLAPRASAIIKERLEADPGARDDPEVIDLAFSRAFYERSLDERRQATSRTLDGGGGGRSRRAADPADAILREMEKASPMGRGISGGL